MSAAYLPSTTPGDIIEYDFRLPAAVGEAATSSSLTQRPLRIVQWNIERGYHLDAIITHLKSLQADIITLQELDISCERTDYKNVAMEIARALQGHLVFAIEFEELDSDTRSHENRCGKHVKHPVALHGNAIVSLRHTLVRPRVVPHSWFIDWNCVGVPLKEPRVGFRSFLCCDIEDSAQHVLCVYSVHLEIFKCGPLNRVRQLGDVMWDAQQRSSSLNAEGCIPHVFIGGDMNTIGHSIVRLSSKYNGDWKMRFLTLGESEATWLQRKVLSRNVPGETSFIQRWFTNADWMWRLVYGFTSHDLQRIRNDVLFLYDPFDKYWDVTLNNPAYHGMVQAKLDWTLLSNLTVRRTELFNHSYQASDHKGLLVEIEFPKTANPEGTYLPWQRGILGEFLSYFIVRLSMIAFFSFCVFTSI